MTEKIIGGLCLLAAIWQFYVSFLEFRRLQTKGNSKTSAFASFAIFYSFGFGVILVYAGIRLLF